MTVGIPRALLYYNYYPAWKAFFDTLGVQTVLSGKTTKEILDQGVRAAVDETCLPVKVAYGHILDLKKKQVSYIFLPRIVSVEPRRYLCPKLLGLPDMVASLLPGIPPILTPIIDLHSNSGHWKHEMLAAAEIFGSRKSGRKAIEAMIESFHEYSSKMRNKQLAPLEVLSDERFVPKNPQLKVAVLGHSYNINDAFISMSLLQRLTEMRVQFITAEMIPEEAINAGEKELEKEMFWTFGKETIGATNYLVKKGEIDGAILLVSFGCGPDSLVKDLIERRFRRNHKPLLNFTMDEHTGEAGMITRVEAFLDMLLQKKAVMAV